MSDLSVNSSPRPVSIVTIIAIMVLFALFFGLVYYVYLPRQTGAFSGDGVRSRAQRIELLKDLQKKQSAQATSYGWVDQKAGVVQLPIDRAMELTVQKYEAKK
jgi:hypothetical protein